MGEYAAFRGGRIAAEDDEQIGPVEIGDGNFPFIAEHQHGGKILGMLVDRARRIDLLNAGTGEHQPRIARQCGVLAGHVRSEEHTSELQSLMRTSYAVFCLKKKTTNY